jgi:hypothetical protein
VSFFPFNFTIFITEVDSLSVAQIYDAQVARGRIDETAFSRQFFHPYGMVAGQPIWPKTYNNDEHIFFDENGMAFNVRRYSYADIVDHVRAVQGRPPLGDRYGNGGSGGRQRRIGVGTASIGTGVGGGAQSMSSIGGTRSGSFFG